MIRRHHFRRVRRGANRGWRDASGAALVEFALVLPLLLTMLLGIVEFGRLWNVRQVMTDAAREGTRFAVVNNNRMDAGVLRTQVRTMISARLAAAGLDTGPARLTITIPPAEVGAARPGTTATITIQYNYPLWFGQTLLRRDNLPLQSTFSMRNE